MSAYEINVLEELKACFNKLQEDIDNVQKQLVYYENIQASLSQEIQDLEKKKGDNYNMICRVESKLERLNSIYANTEQNFNQVQNAAKSLLDIMQTKDEDEIDQEINNSVNIHIQDNELDEEEGEEGEEEHPLEANVIDGQLNYDNVITLNEDNELILGESTELDLND